MTHPSRYDPEINITYQEMAQHYGIAVIPARVAHPRDKAKVEVGVQNVERWILARLRDRKFFSLTELNQAIRELLVDLNQRKMEHLGQSRRELFERVDRPALKPLPATPYEFAVWKKAKVSIDYHVEYDDHYYSVPCQLFPGEIMIRASQKMIEIYRDGQQVAAHPRSQAKGRHSTIAEHMPADHRFYGEWSPQRFVHWAEKIGPQTTQIVQAELAARQHPEQAYRSCLGILGFARKYSPARLEAACRYALTNDIHSYRGIKHILENQIDQLPNAPSASQPATLPAHANIRGKEYYH